MKLGSTFGLIIIYQQPASHPKSFHVVEKKNTACKKNILREHTVPIGFALGGSHNRRAFLGHGLYDSHKLASWSSIKFREVF